MSQQLYLFVWVVYLTTTLHCVGLQILINLNA